jgi:hypothetical protein
LKEFILNTDKYEKIIDFICKYKKIDKAELFRILKDKECKYLLLLLLEKYKCADVNRITNDFSVSSSKSIKYNIKKAEEKFFVNRNFRELYFEMEDMIEKII